MRTVGKILKILVILILIGGLGYGGYYIYETKFAKASSVETTEYSQVTVGTGTLSQSVTGTGQVSIKQTQSMTLDYAVTPSTVYVKAGDQVEEGDVIADLDLTALYETIDTIDAEVDTLNATLLSLAKSYSDESTLSAGTAGRVKGIYIAAGDQVQDAQDQNDCVFLLSLDGYMKATFDGVDLALGDDVSVSDGIKTYDGTVTAAADGTATVLFSDNTTLPGSQVSLMADGVAKATAQAEINIPYQVRTSSQGVAAKIYVSLNESVTRSSKLLYITNIPLSAEYEKTRAERDDKLKTLRLAKAAKENGKLTAETAGIISSVNLTANAESLADSPLISLYVGSAKEMTVSVDELDIINVTVGQTATIEMDAITDTVYDATVSYISQIGTASSGVTNYSVTLSIDGDDRLRIGMNGTATIQIGTVENAVLVPITALNTSSSGDYVWLYKDGAVSENGDPGVKTYVTTGLSSDSYAQVLTGLSAGDTVLVTREQAESLNTMQGMTGGFDMTNMGSFTMPSDGGGFTMPSGGSMPSGGGGGERPSGGFPGN